MKHKVWTETDMNWFILETMEKLSFENSFEVLLFPSCCTMFEFDTNSSTNHRSMFLNGILELPGNLVVHG